MIVDAPPRASLPATHLFIVPATRWSSNPGQHRNESV